MLVAWGARNSSRWASLGLTGVGGGGKWENGGRGILSEAFRHVKGEFIDMAELLQERVSKKERSHIVGKKERSHRAGKGKYWI